MTKRNHFQFVWHSAWYGMGICFAHANNSKSYWMCMKNVSAARNSRRKKSMSTRAGTVDADTLLIKWHGNKQWTCAMCAQTHNIYWIAFKQLKLYTVHTYRYSMNRSSKRLSSVYSMCVCLCVFYWKLLIELCFSWKAMVLFSSFKKSSKPSSRQ